MSLLKPIWLMQPIPYFGENLEEEWIFEDKLDGWRMQIIVYEDGKIEFWGRRLEKKPNWTERLSYLKKPVRKLIPKGTLLDAELCAIGGRRFIPSLFTKTPKVSPLVYIFDVVFFEGEFVGNLPLKERKGILLSMNFKEPLFLLKWAPVKNLEKHLKERIRKGVEGIVVKRIDSFYQVGKEGPIASIDWKKIKGLKIGGDIHGSR